MAGLFVQLKLHMVTNGLRGNPGRIAVALFGAIAAGVAGTAGFALLATAQSFTGPDLAVILVTLLFTGWCVLPIVAFGTDETLDPARLALLPIGRWRLITGLMAASVAGLPALATLVALSGSIPGYAQGAGGGLGALVVVVDIVVILAMCLVGSRAVATTLSGLLRSRRGRDLSVLVISLFVVGYWGLRVLIAHLATSVGQQGLDAASSVLRWLPPGMAGHVMIDVASGRLLVALGELSVAVAFVIVLLGWWSATLDRALTTAAASFPEDHLRSPAGLPLFSGASRLLPKNRVGAVAAKELLYAWRNPGQRARLVTNAAVGALVPFGVGVAQHGDHDFRSLLIVVAALLVGLSALNSFGFDGTAIWMDISAGVDVDTNLVGRNLAAAVLGVPVLIAVAIAMAALSHHWAHLPVTLALGACVLGVTIGVGNVTSVRAPVLLPDLATNSFASRSGQGCAVGLVHLAAIASIAILTAPIVALTGAGLAGWGPGLVLAVPCSLAYGVAACLLGRSVARRSVAGREPELLEALAPRQVS